MNLRTQFPLIAGGIVLILTLLLLAWSVLFSSVPVPDSVAEQQINQQEEVMPQGGLKGDNFDLVLLELLVLPVEERDMYKFNRDGIVTYELNVNVFGQDRNGVIRGELHIYDEKQGEWQLHEFLDPRNDLEYLYYSTEGQMGDPLRSHIKFHSEISPTSPEEERMRLVFYDYPIECKRELFDANKEYCVQQRGEIASQEFIVASGTSEIDTSSWQTYRNEEFGFEFEYPRQHAMVEECKVREEFPGFQVGDGIWFSIIAGEGKELETHLQEYAEGFDLYEDYVIEEKRVGIEEQIPASLLSLAIKKGGGSFRTESVTFFCKADSFGCDTVFRFWLEGYPDLDEYALDVIPSARTREDFWSRLPCKDALIQGQGIAEADVMFDRELFNQILSTFRFIEEGASIYKNIPKDEVACADAGGSWGPGGLLGAYGCVLAYPDAGEACENSDDCMGSCLVADVSKETGTCKKTTSPFGCYLTIENARAGLGFLCAD